MKHLKNQHNAELKEFGNASSGKQQQPTDNPREVTRTEALTQFAALDN